MNVDKGFVTKCGAHTDITSLMGTIELLWRTGDSSRGPITFDLLFSFVHFIENMVLQDRLFYEAGSTPATVKYTQVIENSPLLGYVGKNLLLPHANPDTTDTNRCDALEWAIDVVSTIDLAALRHAVSSRGDCYNIMESTAGIPDSENPIHKNEIQEACECGGAALIGSYTKALNELNANRIGPLGIHILMRIYGLHQWIGKKNNTTYTPHFSRIPLIQTCFTASDCPAAFRQWSVQMITDCRARLLSELATDIDENRLNLQFSPVFLACLPGARSAVDVIDNALRIRGKAKAFRIECRQLEEGIRKDGTGQCYKLKRQLHSALKELDDHTATVTTTSTAKRMGLSMSGPKMEIEVLHTKVKGQKHSGVAFLTNTLRSSLMVVDARNALESIFGPLSRFDITLLKKVGTRYLQS